MGRPAYHALAQPVQRHTSGSPCPSAVASCYGALDTMSYLDGLFSLTITALGQLLGFTRLLNFGNGFTVTRNPSTGGFDVTNAPTTAQVLAAILGKEIVVDAVTLEAELDPGPPAAGQVRLWLGNDGRVKGIDVNSVEFAIDGGWLTFNSWALVSGTYTAHPSELVLTDTSGGSPTITLPDATTCPGKRVRVFDTKNNAASHSIVIATTSAQTIDGNVPTPLLNNLRGTTYISNGANWNRETVF